MILVLFVTAAAAQPICVGDCNGTGKVTINELLMGVNIVLGGTPVTACPALDARASGHVTVADLLRAVSAALVGCPVVLTPTESLISSPTTTPVDTIPPTATAVPVDTAAPTPMASGTATDSPSPTATAPPTHTSTATPTVISTVLALASPATYSLPDLGRQLVVTDATGDGVPDVLVGASTHVFLLRGVGDGSLQGAETLPAGSRYHTTDTLAVADMDDDGVVDLVTSETNALGTDWVITIYGQGGGAFSGESRVESPIFQPGIGRLAAADLDGDGFQDVLATNGIADSLSVFRGVGGGALQLPLNAPAGNGPSRLAVADINFDGRLDVVTANRESGDVSLLLGLGTGTFQRQRTYAVGSHTSDVAIADLNGDQILDVIATSAGANSLAVLIGDGTGDFEPAGTYQVYMPFAAAVGDVNGDGVPDAVVGGVGHLSVLLGLGQGVFGPGRWVGMESSEIAVADLDGDGALDIVSVHVSPDRVQVLLGKR
ncbi:MAG: FG-GAP-like repeat-containing protein [Mycobacterium sp.]